MNKLNCYECKHRNVPGIASCCNYPGTRTGMFDLIAPCNREIGRKLNIKADPHGICNGWFIWPINFDPVWLENCDGFESKEAKEE